MHLSISIQDHLSGHTELEFKDDEVTLDWRETSIKERKALRELIEKAKENGFVTYSADEKGEREEITESVPGVFFNRSGKLILKGDKAKLSIIATGLVENEIKNGKLVMELQDDNSWLIVKAEQFKAEESGDKDAKGKKKTVHVSEKAVGG